MHSFSIFVFVLMSIVYAGCKKEPVSPTNETTVKNDPEKQPVRYLALGDSYTIGEAVSDTARYPNLLATELKKRETVIDSVTIVARTGWTTQNLSNGITQAGISGEKFDLVSILIGVNNQYQGRSLEEYKLQFAQLLKQAVSFAGGNKNKVFVLSIPDYGYTPFGKPNQTKISPEIDSFNEVNRSLSDSAGITYFDITPISRMGLERPELVASDGLHPSGVMYMEWVNLIVDKVQLMVNEN